MLDLSSGSYQRHAETFFSEALEVDITPLYRRFLSLLRNQAQILDAGCGSGRDARAFAKRGYAVTAHNASTALVALAERHVGEPVHCLRFQDLAWQGRGSTATGAALTCCMCPGAKLQDVAQRLCSALKPGGVLCAPF